MQESNGRGCPFCRCEIKGTEPVVIDVFQPMPQPSASKTAALFVAEHSHQDASEVNIIFVCSTKVKVVSYSNVMTITDPGLYAAGQ